MQKSPPIIALVGRTNVGKSTLFNRLLETQKALVSDVAGTTRDRNEGDCLWRGRVIRLVDTGGMDVDMENEIERDILKQAEYAIERADIIVFVLDAKSGVLPQERELAKKVRESGKPVLVVANKAEKLSERLSVHEKQWQFPGLAVPMAVSAKRGVGLGDFLDHVYDQLKKLGKPATELSEAEGIKVAVIGKPNVGKSTLLNAILGEERFITSPIAHTTREPNDMLVTVDDKRYIFIDTAGMRKKGKVRKAGGLEAEAARRNENIVKIADVSLLVLDSEQRLGTQDKILAGFLKHSNSGVIVVANKWDLVKDKKTNTMNRFREYIAGTIPFLTWAPVIFTSALTGQRVKNLFKEIDRVVANRAIKIPNVELTEFLTEVQRKHHPMKGKGRRAPKLLGFKQIGIKPPVFELIIKSIRKDSLNIAYIRFLENRLREKYNLSGTPLKIKVCLAGSASKDLKKIPQTDYESHYRPGKPRKRI